VRGEALQNREPPSWALERVRQYGVVGLFPGFQNDFPFILYTQSVSRPAWSGKRNFHQEKLNQVYEFLITVCAEIQPSEDSGKDLAAVDAFDAGCGFPAGETNLCVDARYTGSEQRDFDSSDIGS
jgi:hypothetical protein